jgi:hypothetical protein
MFMTEFGWILSNNYFYPYQIYIFQLIFFWLIIYYMFISFFKDPGIIPRYNKNFQLTIEEKNDRGIFFFLFKKFKKNFKNSKN